MRSHSVDGLYLHINHALRLGLTPDFGLLLLYEPLPHPPPAHVCGWDKGREIEDRCLLTYNQEACRATQTQGEL